MRPWTPSDDGITDQAFLTSCDTIGFTATALALGRAVGTIRRAWYRQTLAAPQPAPVPPGVRQVPQLVSCRTCLTPCALERRGGRWRLVEAYREPTPPHRLFARSGQTHHCPDRPHV
jgi:hypothetical protein